MSSIVDSGLKGVLAGMASATQHADEIARSFTPENNTSPIEPLVGLIQDKLQVKASAEVIKIGAQLDQTIVDLLA